MEFELARHLPAFIAAAQTRNFSAAARQLGVTPAAVSKTIRTLEQRLGVRLFHRTTHALSLTDEGAAFFNRVSPVVHELSDVLSTALSISERPIGTLRVSLSYQYGRQFILPLLAGFLERYPEVELDLRFEDRVVDMVEEGIDVALGNRINQDANMVARTLTPVRLQFLASPDFLQRHGTPKSPDDLARMNCIRFRSPSTRRLNPWRFRMPGGDEMTLENLKSNVSVTNFELGMEMAATGIGIAVGPNFYAREFLEDGRLMSILEPYEISRPSMMLYYSSRKQMPAKTRVFIDYIIEHISSPDGRAKES